MADFENLFKLDEEKEFIYNKDLSIPSWSILFISFSWDSYVINNYALIIKIYNKN